MSQTPNDNNTIPKPVKADFYRYVIVPLQGERADNTPPEKYKSVSDSNGRSFTYRCTSVVAGGSDESSRRFIKIHSKYWKYTLKKWGVTEEGMLDLGYLPINVGFTATPNVDTFVIWPEDWKTNFVELDAYQTFQNADKEEIVKEISRVDSLILHLPSMDNTFDYATITPVPGKVLYAVPVTGINNLSGDNYVPVKSNGITAYTKIRDWVKHMYPPRTVLVSPEGKDCAVVAGRPDILVYPKSPNMSTVDNMVSGIIPYLEMLTGEDMTHGWTYEKSRAQWVEALTVTVNNGALSQLHEQSKTLAREYNDYYVRMQEILKKLEAVEIKRKIMDSNSSQNNSLNAEIDMLRSWGCYIENRTTIVYGFKDLKVQDEDGYWHMLGDIEIYWEPSNNRLKGRRSRTATVRHNKRSDHPHPHISGSGEICFGDVAKDVQMAMETGNISRIFMSAMAILPYYNAQSPYCNIRSWPYCTEDGTIVESLEKLQKLIKEGKAKAAVPPVVPEEENDDDVSDTDIFGDDDE